MPAQIEPGTPLSLTLRQAVLSELSSAVHELAAGGARSDEALHSARKHVKRARALLRLTRSKLALQVQADLRRAARLLGPAREEMAELECVQRLADEPLAHDFREPIRELAERLRAQRVVPAGSVAFAEAVAGARRELAHGSERLAAWLPDDRGFAALEPGFRSTYGEARRALGRALGEPSAENLHTLRRHVKAQFFQLHLLEPAWPGPLVALRDELDDLGKMLGEHHDLSLFALRMGQRVALPSAGDQERLSARVTERLTELSALALPLARRLYVERPRRFVARHAEYYAVWREVARTP